MSHPFVVSMERGNRVSQTTEPSRKARRALRRVEMGAQNALELVRFGRLSPREGTPFEIAHADRIYRLRYYGYDRAAVILQHLPIDLHRGVPRQDDGEDRPTRMLSRRRVRRTS